jgi:hypothetical protein
VVRRRQCPVFFHGTAGGRKLQTVGNLKLFEAGNGDNFGTDKVPRGRTKGAVVRGRGWVMRGDVGREQMVTLALVEEDLRSKEAARESRELREDPDERKAFV